MATTATKTSTRTKAIAAVAVVAALGLIGYAAAVGIPKLSKLTLLNKPDLTVTITDSADPVNDGDTVTHKVTISNSGKKDASGVQTVITLPAGLTYAKHAISSKSLTCTVAGQILTCTDTSLPVSTSIITNRWVKVYSTVSQNPCTSNTVAVTAEVDPSKTIAEISESNNTASEPLTIDGSTDCADLSVTVTESEDPIAYDDSGLARDNYTVTITNNGTAESGEFVSTLAIDGVDTYSGASGVTDCVYGDDFRAGYIGYACTITSIAPGDAVTWLAGVDNNEESNVVCDGTLDIELTAEVDPDNTVGESDETNNTATETTTLTGDGDCSGLYMDINATPSRPDKLGRYTTVVYGATNTYDITVYNDTASASGAFTYTISMPAGITTGGSILTSAIPPCSKSTETDSEGAEYDMYTCIANLAAAATSTVTVEAYNIGTLVACDDAEVFTVTGNVDITDAVAETDETDNETTNESTFKGDTDCNDLSMTITEEVDSVSSGDDATYTIIVVNDGDKGTANFSYTITSTDGTFSSLVESSDTTYLSCTETLDKTTKVDTYVCTDRLSGGESSAVVLTMPNDGKYAPTCGTSKVMTISGEVDVDNDEGEDDETNNTTTETTTFEGPAC